MYINNDMKDEESKSITDGKKKLIIFYFLEEKTTSKRISEQNIQQANKVESPERGKKGYIFYSKGLSGLCVLLLHNMTFIFYFSKHCLLYVV